mmetsp:Transcript_54384/g.94938  ORF Transcript_54384/g.94938 Transcript_54384/m.94938 type:complete len:375 (-) Transcript_54384:2758-3882(-)
MRVRGLADVALQRHDTGEGAEHLQIGHEAAHGLVQQRATNTLGAMHGIPALRGLLGESDVLHHSGHVPHTAQRRLSVRGVSRDQLLALGGVTDIRGGQHNLLQQRIALQRTVAHLLPARAELTSAGSEHDAACATQHQPVRQLHAKTTQTAGNNVRSGGGEEAAARHDRSHCLGRRLASSQCCCGGHLVFCILHADQHLAHLLACTEIAQRVGRIHCSVHLVRQWADITVVQGILQQLHEHLGVVAVRKHGRQVDGVVAHVALKDLQSDVRVGLQVELADLTEVAILLHQREGGVEGCATEAVQHHINTLTVSTAKYEVHEGQIATVADVCVVQAEPLLEVRTLGLRARSEDLNAMALSEMDRRVTHTTSASVH